MTDLHHACRGLTLSIRQEPGTVWLKLEDSLAMQELEISSEINESTILSRTYHVREAIVIGMRRLIFAAVEHGLIKISLAGSLGELTTTHKKVPLVKWEPADEEADLLTHGSDSIPPVTR